MLKSDAHWCVTELDQQQDDVATGSIIEALFLARGLHTEEEREAFLHPSLDQVQSAHHLAHMEVLKERIDQAKEAGEKVMIYGDYDADGVTATTLLMKTFQQLSIDCDYYIPDRFKEGYGLHKAAIEHFAEQFFDLIITVDTGIANVEEVAYANELGIDVIVTDHHEVQEEIPEAYAIIHPDLSPNYSFKELAGVGVAWQIAHYLLGEQANQFLDLVAIGTIADLVPLIGENRVLVYEGLKRLQTTPILGLKALMKESKLEGEINERDIGFVLGPRINSVGRLQNAMKAVRLLLTEDPIEAENLAEEIEALNSERQGLVQEIVEEAERQIKENDPFIVLANENWHEGVLGIAASRLVSKYARPVMLLTTNQLTDEWKGSARSIAKVNLFQTFMKIKDLFSKVGGHAQAAGMTIPKENLDSIISFLHEEILKLDDVVPGQKELVIDHRIQLEEMTIELVQEIERFAPFGMGNERPRFLLEAVPDQVRPLGQENRHLKLRFPSARDPVEAIGFQFGKFAPLIASQSTVSLVGELQLNEWNGKVSIQLQMEDLAVDEWQLFDYRGKRHLSNVLPYFEHFDKNLFLCHQVEEVKEIIVHDHVQVIDYDTEIDQLPEVDILYIYDLPPSLESLMRIVGQVQPKSIHVAYQDKGLSHTRPKREHFVKVYQYLSRYKFTPLKVHYPAMMRFAKLTKQQLSFVLKVFYDLKFITVQNQIVSINRDAQKAELSSSKLYQERVELEKVEQVLYFSSKEELKTWFLHAIEQKKEEEISSGL